MAKPDPLAVLRDIVTVMEAHRSEIIEICDALLNQPSSSHILGEVTETLGKIGLTDERFPGVVTDALGLAKITVLPLALGVFIGSSYSASGLRTLNIEQLGTDLVTGIRLGQSHKALGDASG